MNKLFLTMIILSFLLAPSTPAKAAIQYQLTDLGVLQDGISSYANAINNQGQIVGSSLKSSGFFHAFLYTDSAMTDLSTLPDTSSSWATAINDKGHIIGCSYPSNGIYYRTFIYSGSTMTDLGNPISDSDIGVSDINNSGQIVGSAIRGMLSEHIYSQALLYDESSWNIIGANCGASAINDSGQIVGNLGLVMPNTVSHAMFYNGSTWTEIGILPGFDGNIARDINNSGQIVGSALTLNGAAEHAFLYTGSANIDLGVLPGYARSYAHAVNNNGQIVGCSSINFSFENPCEHAFLYSGSSMIDLNSLLDSSGAGWTIISATDINDFGQIVGSGIGPSEETHAILLTPIPEPSGVLLTTCGLLGVLFLAWRQRNSL